jgi:ribosome assembly protein 4
LWTFLIKRGKNLTQGHINWILAIAWSPDGSSLVSGDKAGHLMLWDPLSGQQRGKTMTGHKQWITALAWEPLHLATGGLPRSVR